MMMVILTQIANPYVFKRDVNMWRVNIRDDGFWSCSRCVENLRREIYRSFQDYLQFVAYSTLKRTFYLKVINGAKIDTALLGEIIRKAGVKDYEIRF